MAKLMREGYCKETVVRHVPGSVAYHAAQCSRKATTEEGTCFQHSSKQRQSKANKSRTWRSDDHQKETDARASGTD